MISGFKSLGNSQSLLQISLLRQSQVLLFCLMLLISSALSEELGTAMELCKAHERIRLAGLSLWRASTQKGIQVYFLKTGIGPKQAADKLSRAIESTAPNLILTLGYAGALDPDLRVGDLVVGRHTLLLENRKNDQSLAEAPTSGPWELSGCDEMLSIGRSAGLKVTSGDVLTSWRIIGAPVQKQSLFLRFHASIVDMETAVLARTARSKNIALSCVRVVTDDAGDTLLAPFSSEPDESLAERAFKIAAAGKWIHRYSQWKEQAASARESLRRFARRYLKAIDETTDNNIVI